MSSNESAVLARYSPVVDIDHPHLISMEAATANPHRKRSATMFDKAAPAVTLASSIPEAASIEPTHSGTATPVHSASYALLRKKSHRLQRQPDIPFLTLTPEAAAAAAAAAATASSGTSSPITAPPSAIRQVTPAEIDEDLLQAISETPLSTPPITEMKIKPAASARPRSATNVSFKSVDFVLAVEEKLRIDTDIILDPEAHDADPVFHRSVFSPNGPVRDEEVVVEKVGSFDVGCLRKDSLGNLPKITHSPISEDDETAANTEQNHKGAELDAKATTKLLIPEAIGHQEPVSTPAGVDGASDSAPVLPAITRLPGLDDPVCGLISFPPSNLPATPVTPTAEEFDPKPLTRRPTFEHDAVMPATPPECSAEVTLTDVTIKCPVKKAKSTPFRKDFEMGLKDVANSGEERRHSIEASINGMKEILEKSPKESPETSRRASAT